MNSQQAINLLNGLEQRLDDYCELNNEGKAAFRMAITALELFGNAEQLPSAQPEPQWIPWNSGNLPEESGTYAVTAYDGAIKRVTYAKYQKRLKRWELTGARAYWRVLAWMPLPEPYRGEEK